MVYLVISDDYPVIRQGNSKDDDVEHLKLSLHIYHIKTTPCYATFQYFFRFHIFRSNRTYALTSNKSYRDNNIFNK